VGLQAILVLPALTTIANLWYFIYARLTGPYANHLVTSTCMCYSEYLYFSLG
jgi:hypothetical protein